MSVTTVLGEVPASYLGITLPHEHLLIDLRNQYSEPEDEDARSVGLLPMSRERAGLVRDNPYALRDNLLLDDVSLAVAEADAFRDLGGTSMVDCTSRGISPRPLDLRTIAERTGLNIIAGCGYYTHDTHPDDLLTRPVECITDEMVRDITIGIADSAVRAGVIGELGTSHPIRDSERGVLLAAAATHRQTHKAICVHTFPWGCDGLEIARLLLDADVDPAKLVICHVDVELDKAYLLELLRLGIFVEFDNLGKEFQLRAGTKGFATGSFATDDQRIQLLTELLQAGYRDQLLISTDICLKSLLVAFGGPGYAHILAHVVPELRRMGADQSTIHALLVGNPARMLDT